MHPFSRKSFRMKKRPFWSEGELMFHNQNESGFTLVELMVVVAIIGILSAIAVPNYQKYQAKTRQTEAKMSLTNLGALERSYAMETGTYSSCIIDIGFQRTVGSGKYYGVGIAATPAAVTTCGSGGATACNKIYRVGATDGTAPDCTVYLDGATAKASTSTALINTQTEFAARVAGTSVSQNAFVFGAGGSISTGGAATFFDVWTINQDNNLVNTIPGF
jgi:type IV pilus assembly protein PilA